MVSMECIDSLGTNLNIGKHKRVVDKPGSQRETSAGYELTWNLRKHRHNNKITAESPVLYSQPFYKPLAYVSFH